MINPQTTFKNCVLNTKRQKNAHNLNKIASFEKLACNVDEFFEKRYGRGVQPACNIVYALQKRNFDPNINTCFHSKNENKNSKTSYTSKNICISSNLFCYFFEGTPFFRRGAKLSIFHQNQDALRLPQVKLAKVSGKKICKRAEVPPKSLPKQNSKKKKKNDQNEEL